MTEQRPPSMLDDEPPVLKDVPSRGTHASRRRWVWVLIVVLLGVGYYFLRPKGSAPKSAAGRSQASGTGARGPAVIPVVAVKVRKGDIGVYLTGLGAVTPLGHEVEGFWNSLLAGRCGVERITAFDASAFDTRIAAEVKNFDPSPAFDLSMASSPARAGTCRPRSRKR